MKKVLVTGGAGFLGSHLCERLIAEGHDVLCVDNFSTGAKENVAHLMENPRFELMRHDVTFPLHVEVDEIYNLACPAARIHDQVDAVLTIKTSVLGAINALELARRVNAKILQASSFEVYGDPEFHPQPESPWGRVNPLAVRSCYDEGKRCTETLFFDYWRRHAVPIKVARIFDTYGPRMHPSDGRVVSSFIVQALKDEDIAIDGDGAQVRSFCYVDDLIEALVRLMQTEDEFAGPVNIGNPGEVTMLELAAEVLRLTGSPSQLTFKPLPTDEPKQRKPDIALARQKLRWEPQMPLAQGLEQTIAYFRDRVLSLQIAELAALARLGRRFRVPIETSGEPAADTLPTSLAESA
ncbi:MAG: UDP-glucuronic acid decarboxylase family protein [Xanthobacteraceae bacterium]